MLKRQMFFEKIFCHILLTGFLGLLKSGIPGVFKVFQAIFNRIPGDFCAPLCDKREITDTKEKL